MVQSDWPMGNDHSQGASETFNQYKPNSVNLTHWPTNPGDLGTNHHGNKPRRFPLKSPQQQSTRTRQMETHGRWVWNKMESKMADKQKTKQNNPTQLQLGPRRSGWFTRS